MDAAILFVVIFIAFVVMLTVVMMRQRTFEQRFQRIERDVRDVRLMCYDTGKSEDVQVSESAGIDDLQQLMSNPLVARSLQSLRQMGD